MTYSDAISILEKDKALCLFNPMTGECVPMNEDCRQSAEAYGIAIVAIKKQIAMRRRQKMNWKDEAKNELRNYRVIRESIQNTKDRIASVRARKTAVKSGSDSTPVQGGGNKYEDRLLNLIVEEERLRYTLQANKIRLGLIERGLSVLTETERAVLLDFTDHRPSEAVELLRERTGYERTQIYRIYDRALYRFTIAEYGITEY